MKKNLSSTKGAEKSRVKLSREKFEREKEKKGISSSYNISAKRVEEEKPASRITKTKSRNNIESRAIESVKKEKSRVVFDFIERRALRKRPGIGRNYGVTGA